MFELHALGPNGEYRTRNRELITDVAGAPVADMSIVPPLYVARTVSAQRKVRPLPPADREAALARAADMFLTDEIAGLDFDNYVDITSRVSGLPVAVARGDARSVAARRRDGRRIGAARSTGRRRA